MRVSEAWVSSVERRLAALGSPGPGRPRRPMPIGPCRKIADAVCAEWGIEMKVLLGPRGRRSTAEARMVAVHLAVRHTSRSLSEIGRLFRRHHTTVMHADSTIQARAAAEPELAQRLAGVMARVAATNTPEGDA